VNRPIAPGIETRTRRRRDGTESVVFRVRFKDASGCRRSETFDELDDALDFQAKLRLLRRRDALNELDVGRETLDAFVAEWWEDYATVNLAHNTLKTYAVVWNRHALPRLGPLQLRQVTPPVVARFRRDLSEAGVGNEAIKKTMTMLQGVFARAVEWGRVPVNPVQAVRKPTSIRRAVVPLAPVTVEHLRAALLANRARGLLEAVLVSVLAYAGLRPEEALALEWAHIRRRTILVEQVNVDGVIHPRQKTQRPPRTIDLLGPLSADLDELRARNDIAFVFPRSDGKPWTAVDWRNWRRRGYQHIADQLMVQDRRPYSLRHSFASLLIHERRLTIVEIAEQMGHSATTLLHTYAHVIAELKAQAPVSAEDRIQEARRALISASLQRG
jgi:integrase